MPNVSELYKKLVLDDIASYKGLTHPVKAGFFERLFTRTLPIDRLHPNPDDEFCQPDIGPSQTVISRYISLWRKDAKRNTDFKIEPLSVEKMSAGGYMLLDGHHRWYVAHQLGMVRMPVRIMNVTPVDELLTAIAQSERRMCVSFDLDEVLLASSPETADRWIPPTPHRSFKKGLRKNAPVLIRELQNLGFDVWVYSSGYLSEDDLKLFFRYHGVTVDGIVNGLRRTQSRAALKQAFTENYDVSVHIDNAGIICVNTRTKDYHTTDISAGETDWGAKSFAAVKSDSFVLEHLQQQSKRKE